jgi:hypothetical protein
MLTCCVPSRYFWYTGRHSLNGRNLRAAEGNTGVEKSKRNISGGAQLKVLGSPSAVEIRLITKPGRYAVGGVAGLLLAVVS